MDIDIAGWILEFLLRQQSLDDHTLNKLVRVLPLPDNNLTLKKTLFLRKIESEIGKGRVSETILELLEQIEELDHREGIEVSEAMKAAYCAVAVHCTVRFLEGCEDDKEGKYFDAVKRIWRGRVREMDNCEIGLVSESLRSWNYVIEVGVWDLGVCENLKLRNKGIDTVELVRLYVEDAKEKIGPSFLELVGETLSDGEMREVLGYGKDVEYDQVREGEPTVHNAGPDGVVNCSNTGKGEEDMLHRSKHVGTRRKHAVTTRSRGAGSETSRGVKIVDTEEPVDETLVNKYGGMPTPEVHKVQEALETSALELQAVLKDPLPDAIQLAEILISSMARKNTACERDQNWVDVDAPSSSVDGSGNAPQANDCDLDNNCCRDKNNGPKFNKMARNSTAQTTECDNSISSSVEGSPSRPHLPSPKKRLVTPLKGYQDNKLTRRRKMKRWSNLEEDTLWTGVQKYGKGNWKLIVSMYRDVFEERTEVDLKDKWRNMTRY